MVPGGNSASFCGIVNDGRSFYSDDDSNKCYRNVLELCSTSLCTRYGEIVGVCCVSNDLAMATDSLKPFYPCLGLARYRRCGFRGCFNRTDR